MNHIITCNNILIRHNYSFDYKNNILIGQPTSQPSKQPSRQPTGRPTSPTSQPSTKPSYKSTSRSYYYTFIINYKYF